MFVLVYELACHHRSRSQNDNIAEFTTDQVTFVYGRPMEAALFHKDRRRLLYAACAVAHQYQAVAPMPRH
ncbi:MAG TPA: hypothetical protein VF772_26300 [Terriglobales bacterium]